MTRITWSSNLARVSRYYTACLNQKKRADQRLQESIGGIHGKLATRLSLEQVPIKKVFKPLAGNLNPITGDQLTPRLKLEGNKNRVKGHKIKGKRRVIYDVGYYPPKGVSLLAVLLDISEVTKLVVTSAHLTMLDVEKTAGTRIRLDGVPDGGRASGELAWVDCTHYTSRPINGIPDPHLHIHNPTFNVTWDPVENRYKAADFENIFKFQPLLQAAFHSRLALGLSELGYEIERRGQWWDVAGISDELRCKFSRRTTVIQAHRAAREVTTSAGKSMTAVITRAQKTKVWMESLLPEWQDCLTGDEKNALRAVEGKQRTEDTLDVLRLQWESWLTPRQKEELERVASKARARRLQPYAPMPNVTAQEALDHVMLQARHPLNRPTPQRDLVKALWHGLGKVGVDALQEEVQRRLDTPPEPGVGIGDDGMPL